MRRRAGIIRKNLAVPRDMQSAFTVTASLPALPEPWRRLVNPQHARYKHISAALPIRKRPSRLLGGDQRFAEPCFAANRSVSMNNAALCGFVDRRDDRADLVSTGRRRGTQP